MREYIEDTSIQARSEEIAIKVARIQNMLEQEGLNALYLTRSANYAWITAGANGVITICMEDSAVGVLITKDGKKFAITNIIEAPRAIEEEQLEELGFEVLSQPWDANETANMIRKIAGDLSLVGSDIPFENCRVVQSKILPLHYSLTDNEIGRYQYLGNTMSEALEAYLATLRPGMTEFEITGGIYPALWPHNIQPVLHLTAADERAFKYRHCVPFGSKANKMVLVSCNGRYKGLITTTTRIVCFGDPGEAFLKQHETTAAIHNQMIAASKPGVDDIIPHRIGKKAYEDAGFGEMYFKHAQGGPQSYYNRYYNTSENMHGIIQENQCYCYQPVIDGTKVEDAFIATAEGPVPVTRPKSFPKVETKIGDLTLASPGILVIE